jgi:hypothetical protein
MMKQAAEHRNMSPKTAKRLEWGIIILCVAAVVMIFQPFHMYLFTAGSVLVVVGGLAFNLVPLCRPDRPLKSVVKAAAVVLTIFFVVVGLALGSAELYGVYLRSG